MLGGFQWKKTSQWTRIEIFKQFTLTGSTTGAFKNTARDKVTYRIYLLYRIEKYNPSIMANTVMIWMEMWANWQMLSHLSWWIWTYFCQRSSVNCHLQKSSMQLCHININQNKIKRIYIQINKIKTPLPLRNDIDCSV